MKKYTQFFLACLAMVCWGLQVNAQCVASAGNTYCYDNNDDTANGAFFSLCSTDPATSVVVTFNSGTVEGFWDDLEVYTGPTGDNTDAAITTTLDGDLTGSVFVGNPGECLSMYVDADGSVSCQSGAQTEFNFDVSCEVPGCTVMGATNFDPAATVNDGSCTFAPGSEITHNPTGGTPVTETGCGPGLYTDSGGPGGNDATSGSPGNYSSPENGITTICPDDPVNQVIQVTFTAFVTENNWDGLFIYDSDTNDPAALISSGAGAGSGGLAAGAFFGTNSPGTINALNPTGCLTFFFDSDGSVNDSGWEAIYECIARPMCAPSANGLAINITSDGAELTWDSQNADNAGHTWTVEYGPAGFTPGTGTTVVVNATTTTITGLASATDFDFYVTENCDGLDGDSAVAGPFAFTTLPDFCAGDAYTDDGGPGADYSNSSIANGVAETIICPDDMTCEKVTINFTAFSVENNWDGLFIYDSDQVGVDQIDSGAPAGNGGLAAGSFTGTNSPGTITATNATGCLAFLFDSDTVVDAPGWEATAICGIPPALINDQATGNPDGCYDLSGTPNIFDPCTCNVPTEIAADGTITLGNFSEELDIIGVTAGDTWTVTGGTGLNMPVGADGDTVNDANANGILDAGDTVTDANNDGDIQVTGTHDDGVGYDVTVEDAGGVFVLSIANLCNQPRPTVNVPASVCTNGSPFTLTATDALGTTPTSVVFNVTGPVNIPNATEFDPMALTPGTYNIEVQYTAAAPVAPATDGCQTNANFEIEVLEGPVSLSCNDQVQISLDDMCSATVTPDVILEGADGCDPSFSVSIRDNLGNDLGDVVDGSFVGTEWTVRVIEIASGNFCWGSIIVEDKIDPVLDCPPLTVACTDTVDPNDTGIRTFTLNQGVVAGAFAANATTDYTVDVALVNPTATITDLNVNIDIIHPNLNDVEVILTSPDGTSRSLFNTIGLNFAPCGADLNFIADDEGDPAGLVCADFQDGGATDVTGFFSMEGVGDFEGENLNGTWTFSVVNSGGTVGLVADLSLISPYEATAAQVFAPSVSDNCTAIFGIAQGNLTFDDFTENGDCGGPSATTTRTWTATDDSGNTAQCAQTITFERPSLADVTIPADITITCQDYAANNGLTAATLAGAGVPTINGQEIVNGSICNISSTLVSEVIIDDICPSTFKIRREWLVVDWCATAPNNEIFAVQYVKVLDDQGPDLLSAGGAVLDATQNNNLLPNVIGATVADTNNDPAAPHAACTGGIQMPSLNWADACNNAVAYTTSLFNGAGDLVATISTNGGLMTNVPIYDDMGGLANYDATYTAEDECGNVTSYTENFNTEDRVNPICVLDEITTASLNNFDDYNNDGELDIKIFGDVYDDGSWDNCSDDLHFFVSRVPRDIDDLAANPNVPASATAFFFDPYSAAHSYAEFEVYDCADVDKSTTTFVLVMDEFMYDALINSPSPCAPYPTNGIPDFVQGVNPNACVPPLTPTNDAYPNGLPPYNQNAPELTRYILGPSLNQGQFQGHFNICMVETLIEDKTAPVFSCTSPAAVDCDSYFANLAPALDIAGDDADADIYNQIFEAPVFSDNCGTVNFDVSVNVNVNNCGQGTVTRTYTNINDGNGNNAAPTSCTQTLNVFHVNDWSIQFPADIDVTCEQGEPMDFGEPTVFDDGCELIAISAEDETFDIVPDACYKIIRTYTAINWCIYDGQSSTAVNFGEAGNDDRVRNTGCPAGTTPRYEDGGQDSSNGNANPFECADLYLDGADTGLNPLGDDGIVVYIQTIKVQDVTAPTFPAANDLEFCIDGTDSNGPCVVDITLPTILASDCVGDITPTVVVPGLGTGYNYSNVAPGTYTAELTAVDECGNQSSIDYTFTVVDCKAPTPYCVGGLIIDLMGIDNDGDGLPDEGMAETWASDFNAGSFDNCTAQADLLYYLSFENTYNAAAAATGAGNGLTLTCDNAGANTVYLFVADQAGNVDVCATSLQIESVVNVCEGMNPVITGALATETDAPLAGASVSLNTGAATVSNTDGEYSLVAEAGTDVTVIPEHNVYDNTSVTTFDLVLIRQHILTTNLLDSPYKVIAADINNSGSITASDLVAAKQVILGMASEYPNNNAWAFVDAAYEFPADWTLADGYPAVVNVNNIEDAVNADFVAVRVGDVNGTYGFGDSADERNSFIIKTDDAELTRGQEFTVEFAAADFARGYQFTLNFTDLAIVSIDGAAENFGVFADAITVSMEEKNADKLFAVTFKATDDVVLSEALTVDSRITKAEAYNANGEAMGIALDFGADAAAEFALYQNTPNPFKGATVIGFNLPTASAATLTVTDISGKVITVVEGDFAKGFNEVRISDLTATGVLYYQLDTDTDSAVRKMVVIE